MSKQHALRRVAVCLRRLSSRNSRHRSNNQHYCEGRRRQSHRRGRGSARDAAGAQIAQQTTDSQGIAIFINVPIGRYTGAKQHRNHHLERTGRRCHRRTDCLPSRRTLMENESRLAPIQVVRLYAPEGGPDRAIAQDRHDGLHARPGTGRRVRRRREHADERSPSALARRRPGLEGLRLAACARRARQRAIPDQRHSVAGGDQRFRAVGRQPVRRSHRFRHRNAASAIRPAHRGRRRYRDQGRRDDRAGRQRRRSGRRPRCLPAQHRAGRIQGAVELLPDGQLRDQHAGHRESAADQQRHSRSHRADARLRLSVVRAQ